MFHKLVSWRLSSLSTLYLDEQYSVHKALTKPNLPFLIAVLPGRKTHHTPVTKPLMWRQREEMLQLPRRETTNGVWSERQSAGQHAEESEQDESSGFAIKFFHCENGSHLDSALLVLFATETPSLGLGNGCPTITIKKTRWECGSIPV